MELTIIVAGQIKQPLITEMDHLDRLISRGNSRASKSQTTLEFLYQLFYTETEKQNYPVAATSALVDLDNVKNKIFMRADPVLLHADLASLLLFDSQKLSITKEDVDAIFSKINSFLKADNLRLICGENFSRWYLELADNKIPQELVTTSPKEANGQDVGPFLPQGKDSAYWIQLSNEIQMLLYESSINQERQLKGEAPINSVWFWGQGQCLKQNSISIKDEFDGILSNDVNAEGLAKLADIAHENIPMDFERWLAKEGKGKKVLMVLSDGDLAVSEPENYISWLVDQDNKIFKPALTNLKKGRLKKLEVKADDQHFIVKWHHLYRFWRKVKAA